MLILFFTPLKIKIGASNNPTERKWNVNILSPEEARKKEKGAIDDQLENKII